ncbi:MAG: methionyl-tRNA formyltransferase [Elusimicrobiota bacterium]|nr:methionyl-tRNA formyltransferase [Elusimicrobiota bacterium]
MRAIVFSTSPDFIATIPHALRNAGCEVPAVVCGHSSFFNENSPEFPGTEIIRVSQVNTPSFLDRLKNFSPDLFVVVSFGKIFSEEFLAVPKLGAVNIHFSLLPAYRGAAPIEWSVFNGEKRTGITVFKIIKTLDGGDIINARCFDIGDGETASALYGRLAAASGDVIKETIRLISNPDFQLRPQKGDVSYAPRIEKSDGLLDFKKDSADVIYRKVRAFSGKINMSAVIRGERVIIKEAELVENTVNASPGTLLSAEKDKGFSVNCAEGAVMLTSVQPAGKKQMGGWEFVIGRRLSQGDKI